MSDQSVPSQAPKVPRMAERRHVFWQQAGPGANIEGNEKFSMHLMPPRQRWSLRFNSEDPSAPDAAAEFDLSQPINGLRETKAVDGAELVSCRLGPDEWLLIADTPDPSLSIEANLTSDLGAVRHTLVDISHRNVTLKISGSHAVDVLNTGCPLDLGDLAFPVGMATRTLFSKAEIILLRCPDANGGTSYGIECWRSYARYLHAHLLDSAELLGLTE